MYATPPATYPPTASPQYAPYIDYATSRYASSVEHMHATPPAAMAPTGDISPPTSPLQQALYTDYTFLRYAPSKDVPVTYPAQRHTISRSPPGESLPPTAPTNTTGASNNKLEKRKYDREYDASSNKRLRPDGPSTSSRPQAPLPRRAQISNGLPLGTQHNPVEIESSPEPEARRPYAASHPPQPRRSGSMAQPIPSSPPPPYTYAPPIPPSQQSSTPVKEPVPLANDLTQHHTAPSVNQQSAGALETDFVPDPEPTLSPEQQNVVDLIVAGNNVFYTGSAGCGKSTILKAFVKKLREPKPGKPGEPAIPGKRVRIVAPTNLAALNVNGQTTWNFAGWTPDSMKKPLDKLMQASHGKEVWERFNNTDVLVLDEISMVENLQFERLNEVMKASIGEKYGGGPFGGVQVVVTGDFCQLSPVKPFQYCMGCGWELIDEVKDGERQHRCENRVCRYEAWKDIDKWAFRSKAWQECNFKCINLTEIHRQNDRKFISILQKIRKDGEIVSNHAKILLNHASETENAIEIYARRQDVDRVNNENISRLPSQAISYKCVDFFEWKSHHKDDKSLEKYSRRLDGDDTLQQLKEHRYEVTVQLKQGQRVVLQSNLDPQSGLVNGSQGSIVGFEDFDEHKLPRKAERDEPDSGLRGAHGKYAEYQIKEYAKRNKRQPWPIVKFDNGLQRVIYPDCPCNELGNEEPFSLLSRTQIPLMAGYAITVHKSQGMTLDRVIVDLRRAFEASQLYVALSRARSLKGLKVVGLPTRKLGGANAQVKEFFEKYLNTKPLSFSSPQTPQPSQASQAPRLSQT